MRLSSEYPRREKPRRPEQLQWIDDEIKRGGRNNDGCAGTKQPKQVLECGVHQNLK